jgi:hypothetical protein
LTKEASQRRSAVPKDVDGVDGQQGAADLVGTCGTSSDTTWTEVFRYGLSSVGPCKKRDHLQHFFECNKHRHPTGEMPEGTQHKAYHSLAAKTVLELVIFREPLT